MKCTPREKKIELTVVRGILRKRSDQVRRQSLATVHQVRLIDHRDHPTAQICSGEHDALETPLLGPRSREDTRERQRACNEGRVGAAQNVRRLQRSATHRYLQKSQGRSWPSIRGPLRSRWGDTVMCESTTTGARPRTPAHPSTANQRMDRETPKRAPTYVPKCPSEESPGKILVALVLPHGPIPGLQTVGTHEKSDCETAAPGGLPHCEVPDIGPRTQLTPPPRYTVPPRLAVTARGLPHCEVPDIGPRAQLTPPPRYTVPPRLAVTAGFSTVGAIQRIRTERYASLVCPQQQHRPALAGQPIVRRATGNQLYTL
jgi:hypothetical protein